jgi:hypothetical protein
MSPKTKPRKPRRLSRFNLDGGGFTFDDLFAPKPDVSDFSSGEEKTSEAEEAA